MEYHWIRSLINQSGAHCYGNKDFCLFMKKLYGDCHPKEGFN